MASNDLSILLSGENAALRSRQNKQGIKKKKGHQRASTLAGGLLLLDKVLNTGTINASCPTPKTETTRVDVDKEFNYKTSFDQFMLLSLSFDKLQKLSLQDFRQKVSFHRSNDLSVIGERFCTFQADSIDHYPVGSIQQLSSWLHPADLSPFCFPNGVDFYLINRNRLDSFHKEISDRYHLLACTDEKGNMRQGVAITVYNEVPANKVRQIIPKLYELKVYTCAASKITRWWRGLYTSKNQSVMKRFIQRISKNNPNKLALDDDDTQDNAVNSDKDKVRSVFRSPFISHGQPMDSNDMAPEQPDTSKKRLIFRSPFMSPGGMKMALNRDSSYSSPQVPIVALSKSSDKPNITISRISIEQANKLFDNTSQPSLTVDFDGDRGPAIVVEDDATLSKLKQKPKLLAKVAFEYMLHEEVCLVPQCYVIIGGKSDESILHLAALQRLVNHERKVRCVMIILY